MERLSWQQEYELKWRPYVQAILRKEFADQDSSKCNSVEIVGESDHCSEVERSPCKDDDAEGSYVYTTPNADRLVTSLQDSILNRIFSNDSSHTIRCDEAYRNLKEDVAHISPIHPRSPKCNYYHVDKELTNSGEGNDFIRDEDSTMSDKTEVMEAKEMLLPRFISDHEERLNNSMDLITLEASCPIETTTVASYAKNHAANTAHKVSSPLQRVQFSNHRAWAEVGNRQDHDQCDAMDMSGPMCLINEGECQTERAANRNRKKKRWCAFVPLQLKLKSSFGRSRALQKKRNSSAQNASAQLESTTLNGTSINKTVEWMLIREGDDAEVLETVGSTDVQNAIWHICGGVVVDHSMRKRVHLCMSLICQAKTSRLQQGSSTKGPRYFETPTLILVPTAALRYWEQELRDKGSLRVIVHQKKSRRKLLTDFKIMGYDIVLSTYNALDAKSSGGPRCTEVGLHDIYWSRVILGDAHKILSLTSNIAAIVSRLKGRRKWCFSRSSFKQLSVMEACAWVEFLSSMCLARDENLASTTQRILSVIEYVRSRS